MCGRFVITSPPDALRQIFGYAERPNFPARYNVAPTQPIPVIASINGERHFELMRWGLIPSWVKDARTFTLLINARAETVRDKPAFNNALKRRRGIVPADGYYEWKPDTMPKRPYFIHRRDRQSFGFAALFETWTGPNGEEMDSVAIMTIAAPGDMADLHHRAPVVIAQDNVARWLDCRSVDADEALTLLEAPSLKDFDWYPVSTRVNKVANDDAELIAQLVEDEITPMTVPKPARTGLASDLTSDDQGSLF